MTPLLPNDQVEQLAANTLTVPQNATGRRPHSFGDKPPRLWLWLWASLLPNGCDQRLATIRAPHRRILS